MVTSQMILIRLCLNLTNNYVWHVNMCVVWIYVDAKNKRHLINEYDRILWWLWLLMQWTALSNSLSKKTASNGAGDVTFLAL